jgi:hypothetical protein
MPDSWTNYLKPLEIITVTVVWAIFLLFNTPDVLLSDLGELLNHAYKVLKQAFDDY